MGCMEWTTAKDIRIHYIGMRDRGRLSNFVDADLLRTSSEHCFDNLVPPVRSVTE